MTMPEVRALTLRQPWAWAVAHAGKDVENRTWGTSWRGLLGIHAGTTLDEHGSHDFRIGVCRRLLGLPTGRHWPADEPRGRFVAVAELVDVHEATGACCDSPWGQRWQADITDQAPKVHHWVLDRVCPTQELYAAKGRQGLWRPDPVRASQLWLDWYRRWEDHF
jgi:hypothetical protein